MELGPETDMTQATGFEVPGSERRWWLQHLATAKFKAKRCRKNSRNMRLTPWSIITKKSEKKSSRQFDPALFSTASSHFSLWLSKVDCCSHGTAKDQVHSVTVERFVPWWWNHQLITTNWNQNRTKVETTPQQRPHQKRFLNQQHKKALGCNEMQGMQQRQDDRLDVVPSRFREWAATEANESQNFKMRCHVFLPRAIFRPNENGTSFCISCIILQGGNIKNKTSSKIRKTTK